MLINETSMDPVKRRPAGMAGKISSQKTPWKVPGPRVLAKISFVLAAMCLGLWGCDYGRMKEQESLRTYESKLPQMPSGTVPIHGGMELVLAQDLKTLKNPLGDEPRWIEQGKQAYGFYCVMCHGPKGDGRATVGQSFYPLPSDLLSKEIQALSDGEIFGIITWGSRRSPPLGYTVSEEDRWAIIRFIRFLSSHGKPEG